MSVHNEPPGLLRRVALPAGALLGVIAAAGVIVVALRATSGPDCRGTLPLKIATTPAIDEVVRRTADEYHSGQPIVDGKCVQVQVETRNAADVSHELPTGAINPPALWIPDSSMWVGQTQPEAGEAGADAPRLDLRSSLASSPLLIAGSEQAMTKLGWPSTPVAWTRVVDPAVDVTLSDPTQSTEGLATLAVIRAQLGNPDGSPKPELVGALLRVNRTALPSVREAFSKVAQGIENAPVFTASEQSVVANNRAAGGRRVVASYPDVGTLNLDFPLVRVSRSGEQAGIGAAAEDFERALRSESTAQWLAEAGFRTTQGKAPQGWTDDKDGVRSNDVTLLKAPSVDEISELLRTWGSIKIDSRLLAVMDVSGSMIEPMPGGRTRIDASAEAALTALGLMPDTADIGMWAFSTNKNPPNDWIELVPVGPLGEPLDGVSRRMRIQNGAGQLSRLVGGGTALNDTILAAFRKMKETYDPTKINTVTLLTDGRNDDISSIGTKTLVDTLRKESDPARPVAMILVGIGTDADIAALTQIAEATGGKAYQAPTPGDIRTVLLDSLNQRRCRPDC